MGRKINKGRKTKKGRKSKKGKKNEKGKKKVNYLEETAIQLYIYEGGFSLSGIGKRINKEKKIQKGTKIQKRKKNQKEKYKVNYLEKTATQLSISGGGFSLSGMRLRPTPGENRDLWGAGSSIIDR